MEEFNCNKCNSENLHFVRYKMKNGIFILRKQCFDCGYLSAKGYKRNFVKDFDSLPEMDSDLRQKERDMQAKIREIKFILFYYAEEYFKRQLNYYRNFYLKSPEWQHKRKLIMEFYNYKCNRCGNVASDLHHKTYDNIFKEKFEDLEPLCRECHKKEHESKENFYTAEIQE